MPEHTNESACSSARSEVSVRTKTLNRLAPQLRKLDSFNPEERTAGLNELAAEIAAGALALPQDKGWVNVHAHTFFSFSSENYSPERLVWEALMRGLTVVGSTDFDVLDSLDDMLASGDALGIRTTVSLESRAFVDSYADKEINSPGEPGILYTMGAGFVAKPAADGKAGKFIASLAAQSRARNLVMIGKINPIVTPVEIDYDADVLPLTPAGNATERHICAAYDNKSKSIFPEIENRAVFWADVLGRSPVEVEGLLSDTGAFHNAMRAKLMKRGGIGYSQPDGGAFPPIVEFNQMIREAGAVPCLAWLDGMSPGEADPGKLLDDAMGWGALCVNIIPERNWNIKDPGAKAKKLAALDAFVKAARARQLPVLVGTEMNSPGQKFVDSFEVSELRPYTEEFLNGALWLYGHTVMARAGDMGATSAWADKHFAGDRGKANNFYILTGKRACPGAYTKSRLGSVLPAMTPDEVLAVF